MSLGKNDILIGNVRFSRFSFVWIDANGHQYGWGSIHGLWYVFYS